MYISIYVRLMIIFICGCIIDKLQPIGIVICSFITWAMYHGDTIENQAKQSWGLYITYVALTVYAILKMVYTLINYMMNYFYG